MRSTSLLLLSILVQGTSGLIINDDQASKEAPVFYTVVMGRLAYRHQVSLWLTSLRKVGGWKGEAVVITDQPFCIAKTLEEAKMLGPKLSSNADVDVYGPTEGYSGNLHVVKRPHTGSILKMKLEKARAWVNVKVAAIPYKVNSIIYTDEDVVIAKDISTFAGLIHQLAAKKHTLALFRDTGASAGELHTGVVCMFPSKDTDACLQAWGKKLTGATIGSAVPSLHDGIPEEQLNEVDIKEDALLAEELVEMGPDQQALGKTGACKRKAGGDGIKILPGQFFWLPTAGPMKRGKQVEFVHFTNTGRWKLISHTAITAYLKKIGIPDFVQPTKGLSMVDKEKCAIVSEQK